MIPPKATTADEVIQWATKQEVKIADFRFTDLHGTEHHIQFPWTQVDAGLWKGGVAFDGSSIRGWQAINESDMQLNPDPTSVYIDPFAVDKTLNITCSVYDPVTKQPYSRDPRYVAQKAIEYLRQLAPNGSHECFVGPENEFFLFDKVGYQVSPLKAGFEIHAGESATFSAEGHSGHYKIRRKEGYFPGK